MKLRNKVLLTVGIAWFALLTITVAGSYQFLLNNFLKLEKSAVRENLYRVNQTFDQVFYSLATFTNDWAHWNDAYDFLAGKNRDFPQKNLTLPALTNSNINFLGYYHNNGNAAYITAINLITQQTVPVPEGIDKYLFPSSKILHNPLSQNETHGYMGLPSGIMFFATSTVLKSNISGEPQGTLVIGRYLTKSLVDKIATTTGLNLQILNPAQFQSSIALNDIYQKSIASGQPINQIVNDNLIRNYSLIYDINHQPIGMLQITMPRTVYYTGLKSMGYYLTAFILLGIILTLLLWWLLHKLVIKRLERLDNQIVNISNPEKLSKRVSITGSDEISSVAGKVNSLLTVIQDSHEQLENRVHQRTKELKEINQKLEQEVIERSVIEKDLLVHKKNLAQLAHYDSLTGLPNRILFNDLLNAALARAKRHNGKLALFFIDLDRFKNINDALGHHIGDEVIKKVGQQFKKNLRTEDILARLGGDEFILLIEEFKDQQQLIPIIDRLLHTVDEAIIIEDREFFVSTSIGIAIYPKDGTTLEALQKSADMAMYQAKKTGGNSFRFYTAEMDMKARKIVELETNLRKAIANNEFCLFYQPKYKLPDKKISGVEALLRWIHPTIGIISPSDFIQLAEETGLIITIGEWVLREACRQIKTWHLAGYPLLNMAVNLSAVQFRHPNLVNIIAKILEETQLAPEYLELEITESTIMGDTEGAIAKLNALKKMGITLSLDDFGTGYSSISHLQQFPLHTLKIDRMFLEEVPENVKSMSIIGAVILLAHSMQLQVVAEGVETVEQLNYLISVGCDTAQGYLFSKPVPAQKITALFDQTSLQEIN